MVWDSRNCNFISTDKPVLGDIFLVKLEGGDGLWGDSSLERRRAFKADGGFSL